MIAELYHNTGDEATRQNTVENKLNDKYIRLQSDLVYVEFSEVSGLNNGDVRSVDIPLLDGTVQGLINVRMVADSIPNVEWLVKNHICFDLMVRMMDFQGNAVYEYNFSNCQAVCYKPSEMSYDNNDLICITVTLKCNCTYKFINHKEE